MHSHDPKLPTSLNGQYLGLGEGRPRDTGIETVHITRWLDELAQRSVSLRSTTRDDQVHIREHVSG